MVSKLTNEANSSSAEAGPSSVPRPQSASQHVSSNDKSSRETARSLQVPTIPRDDENIQNKSERPASHIDEHGPEPQGPHVHGKTLPQLPSPPRRPSISLRLTINDEAIYVEEVRTVLTEAANSEEGGYHVINAENGQNDQALTVYPRCDGWSEWVVLARDNSTIDNVYSPCFLCHGDGTITSEQYLRSMRRSRRRRQRRRDAAQFESTAPHGQGTHLRQALTNPHEHHSNWSRLSTNQAPPAGRELPVRAARGQERARERPASTTQRATPSSHQIPTARATATNFSGQSPESARARNEILNRRLEAAEGRIRAYLEGNPPDALPGFFETFADEVRLNINSEEDSGLAASAVSPHHTDRYRRAVRDFQAQGLEDEFLRLSVSSRPPRRSTLARYGF